MKKLFTWYDELAERSASWECDEDTTLALFKRAFTVIDLSKHGTKRGDNTANFFLSSFFVFFCLFKMRRFLGKMKS